MPKPKKQKYNSLFHLIEKNPKANAFYMQLPTRKKEFISSKAGMIHSFSHLKEYSDHSTESEIIAK